MQQPKMMHQKRQFSEMNLQDLLKKSNTGLNYAINRDETLSSYGSYSTTSGGFRKKSRFRYTENDDWEKTNECRSNSNSIKPKLTRVVFRTNRPNDPLSVDIYKNPYQSQATSPKYNSLTTRTSNNPSNNGSQLEFKSINSDLNQYQYKNPSKINSSRNGQSNLKYNFAIPNMNNQKNGPKYITQLPQGFNSTQIPQKYDSKMRHRAQYNQHNRTNSIGDLKYHNNKEQNEFSKNATQEDSYNYLENSKSPEFQSENTDFYCDSEEQALCDQITNQDWYQYLPEEVLNNKDIDLDKFFIENSEYFYNLLCNLNKFKAKLTFFNNHQYFKGQNALMKSNRPIFLNNDSNIARLKYNSGFNTTYNKDFFKKSSQFPNVQITDKMKETQFLGQQQLEYTSQKQNDYKDHGVRKEEKKKQKYKPSHKPLMGLTSYNSNFVNWRDYNKLPQKAPQHLSTLNSIPFFGKTSYQDAFNENKDQKGEIAQIDRKQLFKGPIPTYPTEFAETSYASTFKPFNTQDTLSETVQNFDHQSEKLLTDSSLNMKSSSFISQIPSFSGQYKSMTQRDFRVQNDKRFNAQTLKKLLRHKIIKKLEELRDQKDQRELKQLQECQEQYQQQQ